MTLKAVWRRQGCGLVLCLRHPWNWGPSRAATWVPWAAGG